MNRYFSYRTTGRRSFHRSETPVTFLGRESVVLALVSFIGIQAVTTVTRMDKFRGSSINNDGSRYCDFSSPEKIYNITDLLQCMNELASSALVHSRRVRSPEERSFPVSSSRRVQSYATYPSTQHQYPPRPGSDYPSYYNRRPNLHYQGSFSSQGYQSPYYDAGSRYPYTPQPPFASPGGSGAGLIDALTSISQYDDLKCVPRLLCEVATGVIPGNSNSKQNYDNLGGNSLISLLTALDIGQSSPLLTFGKSALTGYTNRGNPSVCYREYPKCPRSNADLVNYLNNHNGGFFRFFGNVRGSPSPINYYRGAPKREPAPPPGLSDSVSDRTGTGELKFDNSGLLLKRDFEKNFFSEKSEQKDSKKVTFPQEPLQGEHSLNRISKSLIDYQETENGFQNPTIFPQGRKDQEANTLYVSNPGNQASQKQHRYHSSRTMASSKAKLYLPNDPSNQTTSTFTFPDGQKVLINVAFSKLFSEGYKKGLRRSFGNDHSPQPVDFRGFSVINLIELYPNDRTRLDLHVVHPCDMICHDGKGTPVQFSQILLHSGSLSTLMTPDQPIIDLSIPIPCEVMCIDRRGEKRQLSTTLHQVLRTNYERTNQPDTDMIDLQDNWDDPEQQPLNSPQHFRSLRNREVNSQVQMPKKFSVGQNMERQSSVNQSQQRPLPSAKQFKQYVNYKFAAISPDHGTNSKSRSHLHSLKTRATGESASNAHSASTNDKADSAPQDSIIFNGGPMPFFAPPIPFMGVTKLSQGPPGFLASRIPGPLGLSMHPMQTMRLPIQPQNGIMQPLGMMSMFPGVIPFMDPLPARLSPISPMLPMALPPNGIQSSTRILMMCGGVLYMIPQNTFGNPPICALKLETSLMGPTGPESIPGFVVFLPSPELQQTSPPSSTSPRPITKRPETFEVIPVATTHRFRPPEGEDYPQQSCLEGQSWNLDIHECVPIKFNQDIETDYTHLPGSPWSGVTRKPARAHKLKNKKKLVIITDTRNITYIKAA